MTFPRAGYIVLSICGIKPERSVKQAAACGIKLKSIKRISYTEITFAAPASSISAINSICTELGLETSVTGKDRAALTAEKIAGRAWLPALTAVLLVCAICLSNMCLSINIDGNETISDFALRDIVEACGAKTGQFKTGIDTDRIEREIYAAFSDVVYANVSFKGTELSVVIGEGAHKPDISGDSPCDIIAEDGGVIKSIVVRSGVSDLKAGSVFKKGDVLISGNYEKNGVVFSVPADGDIIAVVDRIGKASMNYNKTAVVRTGRTFEQRYLVLAGYAFPVSNNTPFELFDEDVHVSYCAGGLLNGILKTENRVLYECVYADTEETKSNAGLAVTEKAYYDALKGVKDGATILDINAYTVCEDGIARAYVVITTSENVGITVPAVHTSEENQEFGELSEADRI